MFVAAQVCFNELILKACNEWKNEPRSNPWQIKIQIYWQNVYFVLSINATTYVLKLHCCLQVLKIEFQMPNTTNSRHMYTSMSCISIFFRYTKAQILTQKTGPENAPVCLSWHINSARTSIFFNLWCIFLIFTIPFLAVKIFWFFFQPWWIVQKHSLQNTASKW